MRLLLITLVVALAISPPVLAEGVDHIFTKPEDRKSWGQILDKYLGRSGYSKSYALIVGISSYSSFVDLPTSRDPIRIKDFLVNEAGFDYVHLLTEEEVTQERIRELMVDELPDLIDNNDRFLFYWSGHGITRDLRGGGKRGYLPLSSSRAGRYADMISMLDIQRWDDLLSAKQAVYLLDSCFSGLAGTIGMDSVDYHALSIDQLTRASRHILSAGTEGQRTIALDRLGGSLFTAAVLDGLRGAADASNAFPSDGIVSLSELKNYVSIRVAHERARAGWQYSITPQMRDLGTSNGEFFFVTTEHRSEALGHRGERHDVLRYGEPEENDRRTSQEGSSRAARTEQTRGVQHSTKSGRDATIDSQEVGLRTLASRELDLALSRNERRLVQLALNDFGHDPGTIDGIVGPRTRAALTEWQRSQEYPATGYLDNEQSAVLIEHGAELPMPYPGRTFRDCAVCPEMVVLPVGTFNMGSPLSERGRAEDEGPQHQVSIGEPIALGKYEVTFREWDACVAGGACNGYRPDDQGWGRGSRPVINVSWEDAQTYIDWLNAVTNKPFRLPTEAEWEYAARAGSESRYPWGDNIARTDAHYGWGGALTAEVGSYPQGAWGLEDMQGNVWEWVEDCWNDNYEGASKDGSASRSGNCSRRVLRGGSWQSDQDQLRSANRVRLDSQERSAHYGFRVARDLLPVDIFSQSP